MTHDRSDKWFAGKVFTKDWTSNKLAVWLPILEPLQERAVNVLEVGTYEGRSAVTFLEFLPKSRVTCIDHFSEAEVEARFDANTAPYGDRVTKISGKAVPCMEALRESKRKFDFIYLDCAKDRAGAFIVSAIGWALLSVGGLVIWDDLSWGMGREPERRPAPGLLLFAETFSTCMDVLHRSGGDKVSGQLIARKTVEWPS